MKVNLSCVSLNDICEGCLSRDRDLTTEFDQDIKNFFQNIIGSLDCYSDAAHARHPLALCWECTAIVRRTIKYQRQVQHAHEQLVKYMNHTIGLHPLSTLTTYSTPEVTIKEDEAPPRVTRQTAKTEPLAFIKVENDDDDDNFGGEIEGYFADEGGGDNENLKAVLKTDPFTEKYKKRKHRTKKKSKVEFDESDDEPLKKRTDDQEKEGDETDGIIGAEPLEEEKLVEEELLPIEYKPRGRRKKKNEAEDIKKPSTTREKAAGVVDNVRVAKKLERLNIPKGQLEMVILTWEQVEEERQKALSSVSFTRHEYRCEDCAIGFNHRFKLDNHMKKHDLSSGPIVCVACRVRCRDTHSLCSHKRRHRVRWRCTICGEMRSRAEVAADHYTRAHGAEKPTHTCKTCGHTAQTLGKLRSHMKNHSERQECELCGKSFRDRASLKTHLFIHKSEKEYSCPHCGKRFHFKKAMEVHLVTHAPNQHLYCHKCDVNFKNNMSYYQHMKYNLKHIDPAMLKFACTLCEKKFAKASRLHEHVVAVHLKATPINCTMPGCSFACSSRPVLRTHVRMVHRNLRALRNHVCHTCGKAYSTKKTLEGHMRSHTGERPFSCTYCSSTFAYEAALYNHKKLVHMNMNKGMQRVARPAPAASPATSPWPTPTIPLQPTPALEQPVLPR